VGSSALKPNPNVDVMSLWLVDRTKGEGKKKMGDGGILVVDDVVGLFLTFLFEEWQPEALRYPYGVKHIKEAVGLYYSLLQVNQQFRRVTNGFSLDWFSLWKCSYHWSLKLELIIRPKSPPRLWEQILYQRWEYERMHTKIDTIVAKKGVFYKSPVRGRVTKGKVSLKKLRKSTFPDKKTEEELLDLLRLYERMKRSNLDLRKKYISYA
jgi:hypothetical protein